MRTFLWKSNCAYLQALYNHIVLSCVLMCVQWLNCAWLFTTLWLQPASLPCPQDFPGTITGVGYRFLLEGIFRPRNETCVSCTGRRIPYHYATWDPVNHGDFTTIKTTLSRFQYLIAEYWRLENFKTEKSQIVPFPTTKHSHCKHSG